MRGWSFSVGGVLGVEIRIHMFFALLLVVSVSYTSVAGVSVMRGVALWLLLLLAVAVREVARGIAAAWWGLELRALLLLPTGALPSFATQEDSDRAGSARVQRKFALVGPIANVLVGLLFAGFVLGMSPELGIWDLMQRPWITPIHLLRSLIWMQLLLGMINLLPAFPLDGGRVLRGEFARAGGGLKRTRRAAGLSQMVAIALIVAGFLMNNLLLLIAGVFVLTFAHVEDQGGLLESAVAAVRMRDVMLTEFSTLSASATLEDAVASAVHTLQDVFPVVRGRNLVGAVSRQGIFEALETNGNGYVQGVMTRSFHTAQPGDSLVQTLQRITTGIGAQLVPVVEDGRVVGIITPQNLSQSMVILSQTRRLAERSAKAAQSDGDV
jgi:CBS domain-containing protein/Zn-dependent protease